MGYTRKPNFNNDIKLGKIGEELVEKILVSSPKSVSVTNATGIYAFELIDVDFIQFLKKKENGEEYTVEDVFNNIHGKDKDRTFFNLYEVKTDTVSLKSRNVVYEVISHDGPGCAALSRAKYFFYIFVDEVLRPCEAWLINMKEWRRYIRENSDNVVSMTECKNGGIALNNFDKHGDHVMNILTNIEVLHKNGIAKKIDIEKYA